jgi:hypothetical protein
VQQQQQQQHRWDNATWRLKQALGCVLSSRQGQQQQAAQ